MLKTKMSAKGGFAYGEKTKTKNFLMLLLILLFLVTSLHQAKAATYYENCLKVTYALKQFVYQPTVDLIKFSEENFARTFKSFPPFVIVSKYLPSLAEISQDTANLAVAVISLFKSYGEIFETAGQALAIIPANLPNLKEVSIDMGETLIGLGNKAEESLISTVAFVEESYNNLVKQPHWQVYPYTQQALTRAKENLESNFNKVINIPMLLGSAN